MWLISGGSTHKVRRGRHSLPPLRVDQSAGSVFLVVVFIKTCCSCKSHFREPHTHTADLAYRKKKHPPLENVGVCSFKGARPGELQIEEHPPRRQINGDLEINSSQQPSSSHTQYSISSFFDQLFSPNFLIFSFSSLKKTIHYLLLL